jgi:hypothetical protein
MISVYHADLSHPNRAATTDDSQRQPIDTTAARSGDTLHSWRLTGW